MDVQIPTTLSTGESVTCFWKDRYYDHLFYAYHEGLGRREEYWLNDGKLVRTMKYGTSNPTPTVGTICLTQGDIVYKPELKVYFPLLSMALFAFTVWLVYRTILRRLLP